MAFGFGKPFGTATTNAANPGIFGNTATTTSASGKWRFILGLLVLHSIVARSFYPEWEVHLFLQNNSTERRTK